MTASDALQTLVGWQRTEGARRPRTVIGPASQWQAFNPRELWRYRDLLYLLAVRDIQVRYRQAALGVLWAVIQPLASMVVLQLVFGRWLELSQRSGNVPYAIFLYAGLVPWMFFAAAVTAAANSFVSNSAIVQKVYFPRLLLPVAAMGAPLVDYVIAAMILLGMMAWYQTPWTWMLLLAPLLAGCTLIAALGVGIFLAALTVRFRDFRHVVPFMIQMWFFATPVIVPEANLPHSGRWLWHLNPMAGVISAFRSVTLDQPLNWGGWGVSMLTAVLALLIGLWVFGRTERNFADVI